MLEVDIDKILPLTEARDNFNKIIDDVEGTDHMYVLTKNGKPSAVIVGVNHLEKLTGKTADELTSIVEKKADETPVVEEVKPLIPQGDNVAGGSKPPETDAFAAGQSIQSSSATDNPPVSNTSGDAPALSKVEGPIDVPVETGEMPQQNITPAPTSSPGGVDNIPAANAGVSIPTVASNQAPASAPTDPPTENGGGVTASDSDLFV